MKIFRGTYSFFRSNEKKILGFSPYLGYINVNSGFLLKSILAERTDSYLEKLLDELFYIVQENLTATVNIIKPIFIISKLGLLNKFIVYVINLTLKKDNKFVEKNFDKIVDYQKILYIEELNKKCNKIKSEDICYGRCKWENECCEVDDKTSDIKNTNKKFKKNLIKFFELIDNCINREDGYVPFYLLGITLMSYWYLIKNSICEFSEEEYIKLFMDDMGVLNFEEPFKEGDFDNVDEHITKFDIIPLPKIVSMIYAKDKNNTSTFPACFECVVNEFLNIYFYDKISKKFIINEEINENLINYYKNINEKKIDYSNPFSVNEFIKLTMDIEGVEYNMDGYNIKSNYNNLLKILNYFFNKKFKTLKELFKFMNIKINRYNENSGEIELFVNSIILIINIRPGHSFSKRNILKLKDVNDIYFNIFIEMIRGEHEKEIDNNLSFIDNYNLLNNIIFNRRDMQFINDLPYYYYRFDLLQEYNFQIIAKKLVVCNILIDDETINHLKNKILGLKMIDIFVCDFVKEILNNIANPYDIKKMNIVSCSLTSLRGLKKFMNLETVSFSSNILKIIPDDFYELTELTDINFSYNDIMRISDFIGNLKKLTDVDFSFNDIREIPKEFSDCKNIKNLKFECNKIKEIPYEVGYLNNLIRLDFSFNNLKKIPDSIGFLNNLEYINFKNNEIEELPDSITSLKMVKELNIQKNKLKFLPENIGSMNNIKILLISENFLEELPISISELKKLERIDVSKNKLKKLPEVIFENLIYMNLSNNIIDHLPFSITKLKSLKILNLESNELVDLPDKIGDLESLEEIILSKNKLKTIPENIGKLKKIKIIFIDNNELEYIPISFNIFKKINLYISEKDSDKLSEEFIRKNDIEYK